MYESYFGLRKNPFLTTPDPDLHLLTRSHREALAALSYAVIARKGLAVLCGDAGTGKTTLLRKLMQVSTSVSGCTCVIFNPLLTPSEFLEMLLLNFGATEVPANKTQRLLMLQRMLRDAADQDRTALLIVDEAHALSPELLEEIRLLTNFETSEHKLMQIILAGHPDMDEVLNRQDLWHVKQRVAVRVQVQRLSAAELQQYIAYRWNKSSDGSRPSPFTAGAIAKIAQAAQGIPRLVNVICENALVLALATGATEILESHITSVTCDLDLRVPVAGLQPAIQAVESGSVAASEPASKTATLASEPAAPILTVTYPTPGGFRTFDTYGSTSLSRRWAAWLKG
jgi:general secretion pathway protein A